MKHFVFSSVVLLCFSLSAICGEPLASAAELIETAKVECARFDDGQFDATDSAVTSHDITGDGRPEQIVDASQFSCSTSASMWGGSGGTFLWVLVEGKAY